MIYTANFNSSIFLEMFAKCLCYVIFKRCFRNVGRTNVYVRNVLEMLVAQMFLSK